MFFDGRRSGIALHIRLLDLSMPAASWRIFGAVANSDHPTIMALVVSGPTLRRAEPEKIKPRLWAGYGTPSPVARASTPWYGRRVVVSLPVRTVYRVC